MNGTCSEKVCGLNPRRFALYVKKRADIFFVVILVFFSQNLLHKHQLFCLMRTHCVNCLLKEFAFLKKQYNINLFHTGRLLLNIKMQHFDFTAHINMSSYSSSIQRVIRNSFREWTQPVTLPLQPQGGQDTFVTNINQPALGLKLGKNTHTRTHTQKHKQHSGGAIMVKIRVVFQTHFYSRHQVHLIYGIY